MDTIQYGLVLGDYPQIGCFFIRLIEKDKKKKKGLIAGRKKKVPTFAGNIRRASRVGSVVGVIPHPMVRVGNFLTERGALEMK